jgi:hypothetical protein
MPGPAAHYDGNDLETGVSADRDQHGETALSREDLDFILAKAQQPGQHRGSTGS